MNKVKLINNRNNVLKRDPNSSPSARELLRHEFLQVQKKSSDDNLLFLVKQNEPNVERKQIMAILHEKLLQYQNEGNCNVEMQQYIRRSVTLLRLANDK